MYGELSLARYQADRNAILREDAVELSKILASPAAKFLLATHNSVPVADAGLVLWDRDQVAQFFPIDSAKYLGMYGANHYFAIDASPILTAVPAPLAHLNFKLLRKAAPHLNDLETGLATTAVALVNWLNTVRFCAQCGTPTREQLSGWMQVCERGHQIFPRIDPAVIMAVFDGDNRILLARNDAWPARRISVLAGYVEAGEGLEAAVRREVMEEVGIVVDQVEYQSSQSWPLPRSLMMEFFAWTRDPHPEIKVDGVEIGYAKFFSKEELLAASRSGELLLPGKASAARALIDAWLAAE
ncbi:MAG: NAD(+) diphosphatase [Trueperella sp.]|nr:NAD(+) diphosphatase [Trueperella sp.]